MAKDLDSKLRRQTSQLLVGPVQNLANIALSFKKTSSRKCKLTNLINRQDQFHITYPFSRTIKVFCLFFFFPCVL